MRSYYVLNQFFDKVYTPASLAVHARLHVKYGMREIYDSQKMKIRLLKEVDAVIQKRGVAI